MIAAAQGPDRLAERCSLDREFFNDRTRRSLLGVGIDETRRRETLQCTQGNVFTHAEIGYDSAAFAILADEGNAVTDRIARRLHAYDRTGDRDAASLSAPQAEDRLEHFATARPEQTRESDDLARQHG